jgi:hypothetical protein
MINMLTDNEFISINRAYKMASDMVSYLTEITGLKSNLASNSVIKDESIRHELVKHLIELEHIKIRLGKIMMGPLGY